MTSWQVTILLVYLAVMLIVQVLMSIGVFKHGVNERDGGFLTYNIVIGAMIGVLVVVILAWWVLK